MGGRLGYVLLYQPSLLTDISSSPPWWGVLALHEGGMASHGGMVGVIVAAILFARREKIPWLHATDLLALAAPAGLFCGRIANFINGELWGRAADVPWAMVFPRDELGIARHPSQLYQAAIDGALLFTIVLVAVYRFQTLRRPGLTIGIFLTGYGCARFFTENFREPDPQLGYLIGNWLTMGMTLSLPMSVAGIWFIWRANAEPPLGTRAVDKAPAKQG